MTRILIIEDEIKTANYLAKGLKENGYSVSIAHDGKEGLFLAMEHEFELVILDIMLPKLDGWMVITELRRLYPALRILFLSARDKVSDRVKGFELGADDYLVKPFSFSELLGRIKALLRRSMDKKINEIKIADLEIDLLKHKVTRCSQEIYLTSQEFSLLVFLAEHTGEVLSRTLIAEAVWDINFNTDTNVVDVAIKRLRQKIDHDFNKKFIHTIRGVGYVFEEH
jgi:two-component system, OmpR family, copper resistance phosphate regulon response regulator CusR